MECAPRTNPHFASSRGQPDPPPRVSPSVPKPPTFCERSHIYRKPLQQPFPGPTCHLHLQQHVVYVPASAAPQLPIYGPQERDSNGKEGGVLWTRGERRPGGVWCEPGAIPKQAVDPQSDGSLARADQFVLHLHVSRAPLSRVNARARDARVGDPRAVPKQPSPPRGGAEVEREAA